MFNSGWEPQLSSQPPWKENRIDHPLLSRVVKDVATKIFRRLASGSYSNPTRMPAERVLSEEFGESRNTVRQAIGFLESYGVVARRAGAGTFVTANGSHPSDANGTADRGPINFAEIAATISPFETCLVRSMIEPEIARLATLSMSVRELAELGEVLEELISPATHATRFGDLELSFLMKICEGTRNNALVGMYRVLIEVRRVTHWREAGQSTIDPGRSHQVRRALTSLFAALEDRRVEAAVACMRRYIACSQQEVTSVDRADTQPATSTPDPGVCDVGLQHSMDRQPKSRSAACEAQLRNIPSSN